LVGKYTEALEPLDWLLRHPSIISVPLLRVDTMYDPLRKAPRFQALLAKYGKKWHSGSVCGGAPVCAHTKVAFPPNHRRADAWVMHRQPVRVRDVLKMTTTREER
jgi:hypothetical protein